MAYCIRQLWGRKLKCNKHLSIPVTIFKTFRWKSKSTKEKMEVKEEKIRNSKSRYNAPLFSVKIFAGRAKVYKNLCGRLGKERQVHK